MLARKAAWGPKLVKNDAPRKVRVNIAGNPNMDGGEQEYVQGKMVDMLVQGNDVYLVSTWVPKPPTAARPTAADQVFCMGASWSFQGYVLIRNDRSRLAPSTY